MLALPRMIRGFVFRSVGSICIVIPVMKSFMFMMGYLLIIGLFVFERGFGEEFIDLSSAHVAVEPCWEVGVALRYDAHVCSMFSS